MLSPVCLWWLREAFMCVCWLHTAGSGWSHECNLYWGHGSVLSSRPRLWDRAPRRGKIMHRGLDQNQKQQLDVLVCTCPRGEVGRWKKTSITAAWIVVSSSRKNACKEKNLHCLWLVHFCIKPLYATSNAFISTRIKTDMVFFLFRYFWVTLDLQT